MNRTRLVFFNTVAQISGQVLGIFLSLITFSLVARHLGASVYGQYAIVTAYLGAFAVAADWSLYLLVVKAVGAHNDMEDRSRAFGRITAFRMLLAIPCLVVGLLLLVFFPYSDVVKLSIELGSFAFVATSFSQLINGVFQAELKSYLNASLDLLYRLLLLTSVALAIAFGHGLPFIVGGMIISALVVLAAGLLLVRPYTPVRLRYIRISKKDALEIFHTSWALGLNGVFSNLLYRIDVLILPLFMGAALVGIYALPEKIMEVISYLSIAFVGSAFPIINKYFVSGDHQGVKNATERSLSFLMIMGAFFTGFVFVFARQIVQIAGGAAYSDSVLPLRIMAFYPIFAYLGSLYYHVAVVVNQQKALVWRTGFVLLLNIVLNFIFIPYFSYNASAVITLVTELIGAIISAVIIYQVLPVNYINVGRLVKIFLGAFAVHAILYALNRSYFANIALLSGNMAGELATMLGLAIVDALLYGLVLFATGAVKKEDLQLIIRT